MIRGVMKVEHSEELPSGAGEDGWHEVICRGRLIGLSPPPFELPEGTKGAAAEVRRAIGYGASIGPGSVLLLSPEETRQLIPSAGLSTPEAPADWRGVARSYDLDANDDGEAERVMATRVRVIENGYVRAAIAPRWGARLASLRLRAHGGELLRQGPLSIALRPDQPPWGGGGYRAVDLPGGDDLWRQRFDLLEATDGQEAAVAYDCHVDQEQPLDLTRSVRLTADSPVVHEVTTIRYLGKKRSGTEAKAEDEPDEVTFQYDHVVAAEEGPYRGADLVLRIADRDEVLEVRHRPTQIWGREGACRPPIAAFEFAWQASGRRLLVFADPDWCLECCGDMHRTSHVLAHALGRYVKLAPKHQATHGVLHFAANRAILAPDLAAGAAFGLPSPEGLTLAFIGARAADPNAALLAELRVAGECLRVPLVKTHYHRAGPLWQGRSVLTDVAEGELQIAVRANGRTYELR